MSRVVESSEEDLARPGAQVQDPASVVSASTTTATDSAAPPYSPEVKTSGPLPTVEQRTPPPVPDSSEDSSEENEEEAVEGEVEVDENGEPVQVDQSYAEKLRQIAKETPEVRFRHSKFYTKDEDCIIAASLAALIPIYKIAETIHCSRQALLRHIENTPILAQLNADRLGKRCDMVEEGLDELTRLRHPSVLMWRAEKLLSNVYGKDRQAEEEDDSILVIGEIPEEGIAEGDAILAEAASKPPEVGLTALLDDRVEPIAPPQQTTQAQQPSQQALPAPAQTDGVASPHPGQQQGQPTQTITQVHQTPPTEHQAPPPAQPVSTPPVVMGDDDGIETFGGGGFDDDFGGNGWLS